MEEDVKLEYRFDYSKARPNRVATPSTKKREQSKGIEKVQNNFEEMEDEVDRHREGKE